MSAKRKYPGIDAVSIEKILRSKGISTSHNRIHQYFKANALANTEPKKGRRRKYVRYERHYSNSLGHTDVHETKLENHITFLDDYSRFIVSYGIYRNATTNNSLKAYFEAIDK